MTTQKTQLDYVCNSCHEPCSISLQDFGIGQYEYWGQISYDHDYQWASDCCGATYEDKDE